MSRSDSDEEFESLQRIERIARKHFEADTWVPVSYTHLTLPTTPYV